MSLLVVAVGIGVKYLEQRGKYFAEIPEVTANKDRGLGGGQGWRVLLYRNAVRRGCGGFPHIIKHRNERSSNRNRMRIFIVIFVVFLYGCKSTEKIDVEPFEYQFKKSVDKMETVQNSGRAVTVCFEGVPFGQAMGILTQETGIPIVWAASLDERQCFGAFNALPLSEVLNVLGRREGVAVAQVGGVYYLGEIRKEDRAFAVLRVPPVVKSEIIDAIRSSCSADGAVSSVGSCLWICDNLESLRKVVSAIETIRDRNERSYVAEIYFIRVNEESFVNLTADLQIRQVDIFSSAFNLDELFQMFVNAEGSTGFAKISQRPVLYLSEGRKVVFSDGKELTREKKTLTENGAVETTGYSKFSDGTQLTMLLNRVSDLSYAVDVDLSVSVFDKTDKSNVPAMDKSQLKAEGLLVQDSKVYYIGSLRRDSRSDKGGLFGYDFNKSLDMITIWIRVRELKK